ncbi:MAG: hypothetical protein K0Q54_1805 [Methylobacterium brachiatum]|jgi:hypothetical protein|nr:hypothetical protein [Methylobacterium brachiatum]
MKLIHTDANEFRTDPWDHVYRVVEPALALAPATFLNDLQAHQTSNGVSQAVATYDSAPIFDWLMSLVPLQGISDQIASRYTEQHGGVTNAEIQGALSVLQGCSRLTSYWHFAECRYRKVGRTCAEPDHIGACALPLPRLRKGSLNQAAYSLALFIRDVCDGDFVGWIDTRLAEADPVPRAPGRGPLMREAVLNPLCEIYGIGPKLWAMMLADLLLGADPNRERWVAAGAWMIAVDSLVHNFLRRTGTLARFDAEHTFGSTCTAPGGCAEIIEGLACRIDARAYNPDFPATFPRFVQAALWGFCAEAGWDICNGNRIDDRAGCQQRQCPAFEVCDRRQN